MQEDTHHLFPPHIDQSRWSLGEQAKPQEFGWSRKSRSPLFAIIHGVISATRSTGKNIAQFGVTNGAVFRIPPLPSASCPRANERCLCEFRFVLRLSFFLVLVLYQLTTGKTQSLVRLKMQR